MDWQTRQGWGARPELIDLQRDDLIIGLVERYDDSILVIEERLEQLGTPLDLAYAKPLNTTEQYKQSSHNQSDAPPGLVQALTELDYSLYQRVSERLDQHLAALPDLESRRQRFRERCHALNQQATPVLQPKHTWTLLTPQPPSQ